MTASVDDIASLCSSIIDIYLCRPEDNCRLAFIQVDDIIELGLKTYLQLNVQGWNSEVPSRSSPGDPYYKGFRTIVSEVQAVPGLPAAANSLLPKCIYRRDVRNDFVHSHRNAGLTIEPRRCLEAIIDMIDLFEALFTDFKGYLCRYAALQGQYKFIRLRAYALNNPAINELLRRFFASSRREYSIYTSVPLAGHRVIAIGNPTLSYEWVVTVQNGMAVASECDRIAGLLGISI